MSSLSVQKENGPVLGAGEQIKRFNDFFEFKYLAEFMEAARLGRKSISIDFSELSKFDPELSELLLDQPEEVLKAAEIAVGELDLPDHAPFQLRLSTLPSTQKIKIRDIRSEHLGKLLFLEGIVRNKSDVRPQVTIARFECPACGAVIPVPQLDTKFREPSSCSCGRKGKFRVLSKEMVDAQRLVLEEASQDLDGGEQPKRMSIFLKQDLVSPLKDKRTSPGTAVKVTGILKEVPIPAKDGGKLTTFDLMIDANNIESLNEDFDDLVITEADEIKIKELALHPNIVTKLAESIAADIFGYDEIKQALVLQMLSGVRKPKKRPDIHMLLIGDPGAGKSALLKSVAEVAPRSRFVAGPSASGAGLTAAVVKDTLFKDAWSLEAGALVLANRGILCIDELDKMSKEDRAAMHEALEQQTVSVSKASVQATLRAETTVLAAANPKMGRFDPFGTIPDQIDMPSSLISRFDLIFAIKDIPDESKDREMSSFILGLHKQQQKEAVIPKALLRKYIAYAKKTMPRLSDLAVTELQEYYLKMRGSGRSEGKFKSVPIGNRQLEGLVRLAEASAKARLSETVGVQDAKRAIQITQYCLEQIGTDPETGQIDMDRISTGITTSQRGKIQLVKESLRELKQKVNGPVAIDALYESVRERGIDMDKFEDILNRLKMDGDILEPRRGVVDFTR